MGIKTRIEWCDSTVNPVMGCTGCALRKEHCYAALLCTRYAGCKGWPKSFDNPEFFPGRLERAMRWKDLTGSVRLDKPWLNGLPRLIFVNNLSDGFCPDVDPFGWLWYHLEEIEASPHIFLLLTKWPQRMREFFASVGYVPDNLWLGVSVENQAAMWRTEYLRETRAAIRFLSLEPLLGSIDLRGELLDGDIHWVIVGSESGKNRRPAKLDWIHDLRDQCIAAGIPFFLKQMEVDGKLQKMPLLDSVLYKEHPA